MKVFTEWHDWAAAEPELRRALPSDTADAVAGAVRFAIRWHGDQRRPTGAPYLDHLLEALEVLVRGAGVTDSDVLCAAVLHDVVEDTPCTLGEISDAFGPRVAELVGWVTIPAAGPGENKAAVKEAYLRGLPGAPRDARLVKLADRASNVQTLRNLAPDRQRSYYAQTVTHIVPLASTDPWFARWYAEWQRDFADLGQTGQPAADHPLQARLTRKFGAIWKFGVRIRRPKFREAPNFRANQRRTARDTGNAPFVRRARAVLLVRMAPRPGVAVAVAVAARGSGSGSGG